MPRLTAVPLAECSDDVLAVQAQGGDRSAQQVLIERYRRFARAKGRGYFLVGGDSDDIEQEALIGLYKAIRDYRVDKDTSFRSFAELCITRQIITAIKGATRFKHGPLNGYISFSHTPAGQDPDSGDCTIGDTLAASNVHDPANRVISSEGLEALVGVLGASLSKLEAQVLALFMEGESYETIGERLGCDAKAVDNALQRVKRKVGTHLDARG